MVSFLITLFRAALWLGRTTTSYNISEMLEYIPNALLKLLYPLQEPDRKRNRSMKVLCLGLGRTGSESLCAALNELGYSEVHHGWRMIDPNHVGECPLWYRLALAKFKFHNTHLLTRSEFDKAIGHCEAVTDIPCAHFGIEILRAYPEAQVILNRRQDVEAWYNSQSHTIDQLWRAWPECLRSWVESEHFWIRRMTTWVTRSLWGWDFETFGREAYYSHYAGLEEECRRQGRVWLDWTVEDGWEPLCGFLGKEVPGYAFPSGNSLGVYAETRARFYRDRVRRGNRRLVVVGMVVAAAAMVGVAWYLDLKGQLACCSHESEAS